jgi:hypothetical protein
VDFSNFEIAIVDDFRRTGERRLLAGKRPLIGQQLSDFGLLGHLDTKVSNCDLELRMGQE